MRGRWRERAQRGERSLEGGERERIITRKGDNEETDSGDKEREPEEERGSEKVRVRVIN